MNAPQSQLVLVMSQKMSCEALLAGEHFAAKIAGPLILGE